MSTEAESVQIQVRRSQLYRWHQQRGACYTSRTHPLLVSHYENAGVASDSDDALMLCDLSLLERTGYKGRGAGDWLSAYATLPDIPNEAVTSIAQNTLVARLSNEEYLLIDGLEDTGVSGDSGEASQSFARTLDQHFKHDQPSLGFSLPRRDSHCLFALYGQSVPAMMAKLCAIDMSTDQFVEGAVAQTSVARLNAIVIRQHGIQIPKYLVLADVSAAEYLWHCLLDAMIEFSGVTVGLDELLKYQR